MEELFESIDGETASSPESTLSGLPVADRQRSWENFKAFSSNGHRSFEPSPPDINLIVSVEDTGVGIPLEAQSRIFTPFMQVGPSISRTHGGTGIGLSISKCLVGLMKGEIGFSSTPKVGSTFTFTAVFSNGMQPTERKNDPQNNNQPIFSEFRGMKAVVVDHRPARAKVSWYHFQRLGIRVEVVPRVEQALHYMKIGTNTVNMILIEQEIWNREADVFIKKLQKDPLVLSPKLILLANSVESSISDALSTGIDPPIVIVKPLRASMLAATLQRGLGIGNREPPQHKGPPALILRNLLLGRKILIVDDNNVNLRVAAGALKKYGADVVCAESGIKAISLLKPPHEFDACFMDIQMPEMDGYGLIVILVCEKFEICNKNLICFAVSFCRFEATRRIRDMEEEMNKRIKNGEALIVENGNKSSWHLPVLAMTADVIQATHEECLKCGMDGYVSKPFEAEQLYREVSRFFNTPSDTES